MGLVRYFNGGEWKVLYKKQEDSTYKVLKENKFYWYADPFLFPHNGELYLFTEAFDKRCQIGRIACSILKRGYFTEPSVIIKNKYHMSYPDVFKYNGKIYMLPESGESNEIELYEATDFPTRWKKHILKEDVYWADTTVYQDESGVYALGFDEKQNKSWLFKLDLDNISLIEICEKVYNTKEHRPGGQLFINEGILYRPTQDCKDIYGEALIINRVNNLYELDEEICRRISADKIDEKYSRIHTYNQSCGYEVVDVYEKKKGLQCLYSRIIRKIHKLLIKHKWF